MPESVQPDKSAEESKTDDQQATGSATTPEGGEVSGDGSTAPEVEGDDAREDELPAWARKKLEKANAQAASYRTQLRDAQTALENAKTPEEFQAATATLTEKVAELEHQLVREQVARKYELPDELATLLTGKTADELEAVAKTLQKYAPTTESVVLGGGLTPDDGDDGEMDPRKLARRTRR
ncbi:hypothetical protein ALI22I_33920 [Saccharothrix sp. ALI-22-I]|uniref:DUF7239 family protein n=1 Tax=Saccharothrix sp. ALI-22-I TaxID=1933778 RepID=UPI00097BB55F|nr:hypothetical protein [Saccharothrix sp. ALI-22-I]ONI83493.1 hypothetical protein ALI22I_33920 [Saccharothrix sp. ALI-22-I]